MEQFTKQSIKIHPDDGQPFTEFNGQTYGHDEPYHASDRNDRAERFDCDANGNMTARIQGSSDARTLVCDGQKRLSKVQNNQSNLAEQYWCDVDSARQEGQWQHNGLHPLRPLRGGRDGAG